MLNVIISLRQGAAGVKGQTVDREIRGSKESRAVPAPDANAESVTSMQVHETYFEVLLCFMSSAV